MSAKVVTFGEIMMRLGPPALQRFSQADNLELSFGGAEANVAVSLALLGCNSAFITAVPDNPLGNRALAELRCHGVNLLDVVWSGGRLGLYFMESGANQRSGQVVYDRAGSAFAELDPASLDWPGIMNGDWFHISGITPALGENTAKLSLEAMRAAKAAGLKTSLDINYRSRLWNYGKTPAEVLEPMLALADVLIAGRGDCQQALDIHGKGDPDERLYFETLTETVMDRFPNIDLMAVTIRDSRSAEHHNWAACLRDSHGIHFSRRYEIRDIVDRVGSGDAFSAGLIYSLLNDADHVDALEFAAAANCLKHSVSGDFNLVTRDEIMDLMESGVGGRVKR